MVNGDVSIQEARDYDNWNGGTYGHALTLAVPDDIYLQASESKGATQQRLHTDINALVAVSNEHFSDVYIEMKVSKHDRWREKSGVYKDSESPSLPPNDALQRIWSDFPVRIFLSHKAKFKVETSKLKHSLAKLGVGAFVAHEDIEPTEEWQKEIESAIFSMDAMVALLTPDYHDSNWTDQEVGAALGRGVPLITVKLGMSPYGFMGKKQAMSGSFENTGQMAATIF